VQVNRWSRQRPGRQRRAIGGPQLATPVAITAGRPRPIAAAHRLAQVGAIGHHRDPCDHMQRMRGAEEPVQRVLARFEQCIQHQLRQLPPARAGVHFLVRQGDRPVADVLVR
jgi:hypothetical protein